MPIRVGIVGEGAMARVHLETLAKMPGVSLTGLAAGDVAAGHALAIEHGIRLCTDRIETLLAMPDVDAVVITSPSGLHEAHARRAAEAGKPCLIEIPAGLSLASVERLDALQRRTGVPMMVAHSRRFSPAHRTLRARMQAGEFHLHHLVVETYFLRRTNLNMFGQPRSWVDNLLWHHACHSVDLATWLLAGEPFDVWATQGPPHPVLGITMDLAIGLRGQRSGTLVTMALSFNNKGPFGGFYRYIGEEDTCHVFRDELKNADGEVLATEGGDIGAFERQDAAFIDGVRRGMMDESSLASVLPAMRLLDRIEQTLSAAQSAP